MKSLRGKSSGKGSHGTFTFDRTYGRRWTMFAVIAGCDSRGGSRIKGRSQISGSSISISQEVKNPSWAKITIGWVPLETNWPLLPCRRQELAVNPSWGRLVILEPRPEQCDFEWLPAPKASFKLEWRLVLTLDGKNREMYSYRRQLFPTTIERFDRFNRRGCNDGFVRNRMLPTTRGSNENLPEKN